MELQEGQRQELEARVKDLEKAIVTRDQEIQRLSLLYKGGQNFEGVKVNFDKQTAEI